MAIHATIIGNLGADAEQVTIGQNGTQAVKFRVASTYGRLKTADGKKETEWVSVMSFRTQLTQYLTKGAKVAVTGELEVNRYTNKDGQASASLQMVADGIEFCGASQQAHQPTQVQEQPSVLAPPAEPMPPQENDLPF